MSELARLRPIPRSLLPDAVEVFCPTESDYGGTFEQYGRTISHVRFNAESELRASGHVLDDGSTGLLFIDAVSSDGAFEVPVGSKVILNGEEPFKVARKCTVLRGFDGIVHHWEVELA